MMMPEPGAHASMMPMSPRASNGATYAITMPGFGGTRGRVHSTISTASSTSTTLTIENMSMREKAEKLEMPGMSMAPTPDVDDPPPDGGLVAWLQALGGFIVFMDTL